MNFDNGKKNNKGVKMYFIPEIAEKFAELEQNEKNFRVAEVIDLVLMQEIENFRNPIHVAELGGGAHPDRYHGLFERLEEYPSGQIDWVDISPYMLNLAEKYLEDEKYKSRKDVVNFIESDILEYLENLKNGELDAVIMKYTLEDIRDIKTLFRLLSEKIKSGGKFVATVGLLDAKLKSFSTNARFLYKDKEFPDDETRILKDGEKYGIKFLKRSGDPDSGYLPGAETEKYFHSAEKIEELAELFDFDLFLGNWKEFLKNKNNEIKDDQNILVLTKIKSD